MTDLKPELVWINQMVESLENSIKYEQAYADGLPLEERDSFDYKDSILYIKQCSEELEVVKRIRDIVEAAT